MYRSETFHKKFWETKTAGDKLTQFLNKNKLKPGRWWVVLSYRDQHGNEAIQLSYLKNK